MCLQRSSSLPDVKRRFHLQIETKLCGIGFHVAFYLILQIIKSIRPVVQKIFSKKFGKQIFFKKYIFCAFCSDGQEKQLLKILAESDC